MIKKGYKMEEIKEMKNKCHAIFDAYWSAKVKCNNRNHIVKLRRKAYHKLAKELGTDFFMCHFSKMNDINTLQRAYEILLKW